MISSIPCPLKGGIFSPNGDNINDRLVITAAPYVEKILSFSIYDRWGNVVFSVDNFIPGDPGTSWDATVKGKPVNPGVFAYKIIIQLINGRQEIKIGDVTVVR